MEITIEPNRTQLLANATNQLKPIKNKKELVAKFNEITGQKQASLPRVVVKLLLEKKITNPNQVVAYINNRYNEDANAILTKAIDRIRTENVKSRKTAISKNEEYAKKVQTIKEKRANEIKRDRIQEKLDKRAIYKSKEVDMKADNAIRALEALRLKKKNFLAKERFKVARQKDNLEKLKADKKIDKEFYNAKKKRYTKKNQKLDQLQKKYENSEFNRMEREKLRINLERKKEKADVRRHLRTQEQKDAFRLKYGTFTKNDLYNDDEDNYDEIRVESAKLVDSLKHFSVWRITMTEPASNLEVFYRYINDMLDAYKGNNVVLYVRDNTGNGVRHITINGNYLYSFEDFEDRINDILSGDVAGSDTLTTSGNYMLMLDTFDIQLLKLSGYADAEYNMIYKSTKNTDHLVLDCGFKAVCCCLGNGDYELGLTIMKTEYKIDYNNVADFTTTHGIIEFIVKNKLKIYLVPNGIVFKDGVNHRTLLKDRREETKINNKKILVAKINNADILKPKPLNQLEESLACDMETTTQFIIFDAKNSHFEFALNNKLEINDNVFIGADCSLFKCEEQNPLKLISERYRRFMSCEVNNYNLNDVKHVETYYVGFDFETIIDYDSKSRMRPYSVSYGLFSQDDMIELDAADKNNKSAVVKKLRAKNMKTSLGFDCIDEFIKWIVKVQVDKKLVFIGFNNSNFDNYILIDRILEMDCDDIRVGNIMYNGSQLLNAIINGRHTFFDLSRHILGTLNDCCVGFKVGVCAKQKINHHFYQEQYDTGKLIDYITGNEELVNYNENDVLSVLVIYNRYKSAIAEISGMEELSADLHNNLTIGSLSYKRFSQYWKIQKIKLPKLTEEQYYEVLKYKCAGRVEMFNGKQFIYDEVSSFDVCSLYPYVMAILNCYYPAGDVYDTDKLVDDKIGFYWCDIDQSNLKGRNLPNIYPRKTETENEWDYDGMLFNYCISSVMIKLLRKYGCEVIIHKGFYFTEKVKSCEMFKPILEMMKLKVEQDELNKKGDSAYNSVLRETTKLLMNAPSGKVIEGLHINNIEFVGNIEKLVNLQAKYGDVNVIKAIGKGVMVEYKRDELELLQEEQRPIFLGVLIYDYAKTYMYENSYAIIGKDKLLYTDTDATKLRVADSDEWLEYATKTNVPYWNEVLKYDKRYEGHKIYDPNSKVFGSYEDELAKMNKMEGNAVFCCIQKKSWCYAKGANNKFRFKGLNENNIILTGDEDFITLKNNKMVLDVMKQKEINNFYNTSKDNLKNNVVDFYRDVYDNIDVLVLCRQFKKNVRNAKKYVGIDEVEKHNDMMNSVSIVYMIKKVKVK